MKYFILIILFFLFSFCSRQREIISEDRLKEFDGYSMYYHRSTIFINSFENYKSNCSPIIAYYSGNKVDSISNKLNKNNGACKIDSVKIKSLAQKFLLLYPKYEITNLSYFPNYEISFGYSKPSKPEYLKFTNDSLIHKYITLDDYERIGNGWYKMK